MTAAFSQHKSVRFQCECSVPPAESWWMCFVMERSAAEGTGLALSGSGKCVTPPFVFMGIPLIPKPFDKDLLVPWALFC